MKLLIIFTLIIQSATFALSNDTLKQKNINKQMEREKEYAQKQQFYQSKEYNLKSFEVDQESVNKLPDVPDYNEDFDMDDVYD